MIETQKKSENGEIYTTGKKFFTATGSDGSDKYHLWYYQVPSTHLYIKQ